MTAMTSATALLRPGDPRVGRRATPDELSDMPENNTLELVGGFVMEKPVGAESSKIGGKAVRRLAEAAELVGLDIDVYGADAEYQCFADDPDLVRKPDASVVLRARLPGGETPRGRLRLPADLAVEVVSPNDIAARLAEQVAQYLRNGFKLVWVIYPDERHVIAYRPDSIRGYLAGDDLDASPALPGVKFPVGRLFD